ncbi:NUDIX hydrolase [Micromonospora sp. NPDC049240]|uniref:NUDIX hydrolase n=1 Tax=Micromonospora sp. NPDC049240 TaxID=3155151 RepID=UPI0033DB50F7
MTDLLMSDRLITRRVDADLVEAIRGAFGDVPAVVGAMLMGSRSRGIAHARSNVDIQIIIGRLDTSAAEGIANARDELAAQLDIPISVNVHTLADAQPSLGRYELFQHKNRAELFIYQAKYTSVKLFGRNIFAEFTDPAPSRTRREAIRTIASFSYFLRKFLFDVSMAPHGEAEFVRTPLISLEYIAAFYGYLSLGYRDGLDHLTATGRLTGEEIEFLEECATRKATSRFEGVNAAFALRGATFLDAIHGRMLDDFRRRGVSDVRWDGQDCAVRWNIELPQAAAMSILWFENQALLVQRRPDDYLYPGQWTIPGGYLQAGEDPRDGAAREVWEETGTYLAVSRLFGGQPVVSSRLAAFSFEVELPDSIAPHLTEHSNYRFVDVGEVLSMDLTPEARLIFERRLNKAHRY